MDLVRGVRLAPEYVDWFYSYLGTLLHKWLVVPVANPPFVPVLEPGQGFRDKSLEAFVPGGRTGTKGA